MSWTLTQAQTNVDALNEAYLAIVQGGASYEISTGGTVRKFTRLDLKTIRSELKFWCQQVQTLSGKAPTNIRFVTHI